MVITITLPERIKNQLQCKALGKHASMEELVLEILGRTLESDEVFPPLEELITKIKTTPPNPRNIRPAIASLADALRHAPKDHDFDLAVWNQNWEAVEKEMQEMTRVNSQIEKRG